MSSPDLLSQRYGAPSPWRRRLVVLGSVLVAAVSLGWLLWVMLVHGNPAVESDVSGWEIVDEHEVRATVVLTMDDDVEDVRCLLRAVAADKVVVGEQSWTPTPQDPSRQEISIRTERRATAVELVGCTAEGQQRPR